MEKKDKHIDINILTRSIAGESSVKEQEEVAKWLADSRANKLEYDKLKKTWKVLDQTKTNQEINIDLEWKHLQSILPTGQGQDKRVFLRTFLRVAAAILILFGIGITGMKYFTGNSIKTDLAETEIVILPDGSQVTLNAGSKLSYSKKFAKENRLVALQGEAYFEVEKDPDNPFIIEIDDAEIQVLGTSFNVRAYKGMKKIEVTVTEGKVSLYDKEDVQNIVIAVGGEKAEYIRSGKFVRKTEITNRNYLSWKTRLLVFEDDNLKEVVETITKVYHKEIRIKNQDLVNCRLTTRFEEKDLDSILKILESTFDLSLVEEKNVIYLSGIGCD